MRDAAWEAFPRSHARTQRFTLGEPRGFRIGEDGKRVAFLRSAGTPSANEASAGTGVVRPGADPVQALWVLDLPEGRERLAVDPRDLEVDDGELPPEERARRERARESGAGIVSYSCDRTVSRAAFALGGRLFVADPVRGGAREVGVAGPVVSPLMSPSGESVVFVRDRALVLVDVDWATPIPGPPSTRDREQVLAVDGDPDVTWGLAEFIAAEEMGRQSGMWWSPDGSRLLASRVDVSRVQRWHISNPAQPAAEPVVVAYPAAGTPNAAVQLALLDRDGRRVDVEWDSSRSHYLADAGWSDAGPFAVVQPRDQRTLEVLAIDPATGATTPLAAQEDERWVELVSGAPARLDDGRVLLTVDNGSARRLLLDGRPLTPADLQVRRIAAVTDAAVLVTASADDPTAVAVWRVPFDGGDLERLTSADGVHDATASEGVRVLVRRSLDSDGAEVVVHHAGGAVTVRSTAERPQLQPRIELLELGSRRLAAALLLPRDHDPDGGPLPVLLDPYGGPHAQRVLQARSAFGTSQWFADAGYAVLVVDGRGTPGRGPEWERELAGDLATPPLEDQIDALAALAEQRPGLLDLGRVAIRGWSFGGFLAALAVLRRPDVFHAAIAGAPVTDWRLYDTHYTERYLGHPDAAPEAYQASSLLGDAARRPFPEVPDRPLLLIHGLADDNVIAAHTLRLSQALLEGGRPHRVLPLTGVTHMTPQEIVAENLLRLQLDFLDEALRPAI